MSTDPARPDTAPPRPDARLVPAALTVWLGVAAGLLLTWWCTVLAGTAAVAVGGWLLARRRWDHAAAWVLVACGVLTAGVLAAGVHRSQADPLRAAAATNASARLRVELTNRPKPLSSTGFGGRQAGVYTVLVEARVVTASVRGGPLPGGGDVLLFAPPRGWDGLLIGQQVTVTGTLTPARGGDTTVAALRVRGPPSSVGPPGWGQHTAATLRTGLRRASAVLDPAPAGLLPGLVDGDTGALPMEVTDDFRTAGLTHLTAVSGTNLAIVAGAVLLLLRALRVGPRLSAAAAGLAIVGFVILAGPDPSVLRAAVMGAIALAALAAGRPRAGLAALAAAVIVLVTVNTALAVSLGFVLSVLATGGLLLLAPRWAAGLQRRGMPRAVAQAVAVPVAAHLVTAPVIAGISGQVSLVSILANLLVAPVVAPATVFGVLAAVFAPLVAPLATFLVWLAAPEVYWITGVATRAADLPAATVPWPSGWVGALLLTAVSLGVLLALRFRRSRVLVLVAVLAVLVVTGVPQVFTPGWPAPGWAMVSCDVGEGDGEVLATADPHRAVVVDTGPDGDAIDDCLSSLGVTEVPLVMLSHLHADHVGGLAAVLAGRTVGAVAMGPSHLPSSAMREIRAETAAAHVPLLQVDPGEQLRWPGLTIDVLGPMPADVPPDDDQGADGNAESGHAGTEINNTSVVLRASTGAGRILLTGDVEPEAQTDLLASGADLSADVLKIPHHGSRNQSPAFLAATRARIAIASAGQQNSYGHPNPTTLATLAAAGALVLHTDRDGDVAVIPGAARGDPPRAVCRGDPRPPPHHKQIG